MVLKCFICSKKGNYRENNEDNLYINGKYLKENHPDTVFYEKIKIDKPVSAGVFDGLGGEAKGEEASYMAAAALCEYNEKEIDFKEYFISANKAIYNSGRRKNNRGSTAAILYFDPKGFIAANIGDSRIYRIRNSKIVCLTTDHTMIEAMVSSGVIKREDADKSKYKNYLTRYLGMYDNVENMAAVTEKAEYKQGDIFILCSDGLSGVMEEEEILNCVLSCEENTNPALQLTNKAYEKGSKDNTTVIVIYTAYEKSIFGRIIDRFKG